MEREGDTWQVETADGLVLARSVELGTIAHTDALRLGLKNVFTTIHYLQFAARPLGPEAAHILSGRQGVWDTGQIMFNVRRDARDRLLVGTIGRVMGSKERGLTRRWAQKRIAAMFPELGGL